MVFNYFELMTASYLELRREASGLISMHLLQRALPFDRMWKNSGWAFGKNIIN